MMILIGMTLAAGFVFALRSQVNVYRIGQAEERLKTKLDEYSSQQKFLTLDQQRALNTSESDRVGKRNGLDQLKLDQPAYPPSASMQRIIHQIPEPARSPEARSSQAESPQAGQTTRLNGNHQNRTRSTMRQIKPNPREKAVKTVKAAKVVKVVKSNVKKANAAPNRSRTTAVKAKKQSNDQRQASRSQQRR